MKAKRTRGFAMPIKFFTCVLMVACCAAPVFANVTIAPAQLDVTNVFIDALDGKYLYVPNPSHKTNQSFPATPSKPIPAPTAVNATIKAPAVIAIPKPQPKSSPLVEAATNAANVQDLQTTLKKLRDENELLKLRMEQMNQQLAQLQQVISQTKIAVLTVPPNKLANALPARSHPMQLASNTVNPSIPATIDNTQSAEEQAALLERQIDLKQSNVSAGKMKTVRAPVTTPDIATIPLQPAPSANTDPKNNQQVSQSQNVSASTQVLASNTIPPQINAATARPDIPQPPQTLNLSKGIANTTNPRQSVIAGANPEQMLAMPKMAAVAAIAPTVAKMTSIANSSTAAPVQPSNVSLQQVAKPVSPLDSQLAHSTGSADVNENARATSNDINDQPATDTAADSAWWQNPLFALILSGGLVVGALALLIAIFWPKPKSNPKSAVSELELENSASAEQDEKIENTQAPEEIELEEEFTEYLEEQVAAKWQHETLSENTIKNFEQTSCQELKDEEELELEELFSEENIVQPPEPLVFEEKFKEEMDFADDEYDFMESEDAIPIKLDLARAYLEMNDFAAVELALRSVLQQGSEEQREEAKLLLEQAKLAQLEV